MSALDGLWVDIEVPLGEGIARCAFSMPPQGVHGIIGPSGAGKTSLLRCLLGTLVPRSGKIRFNGTAWFDHAAGTRVSTQRRKIGMVFQDYALFSHLTVSENVFFAARGVAFDRTQWLEKFHIAHLATRFPQALSGGEKQRAALARALWPGPQLLLLDEPFSALDRTLRQRLREQVEELLADLRIPMILVSHDLDEVRGLCDSVSVLLDGRIAQHDTTAHVYTRPASRAVAEFLGWQNILCVTAMNADWCAMEGKERVGIPLGAIRLGGELGSAHLPLTIERMQEKDSFQTITAYLDDGQRLIFTVPSQSCVGVIAGERITVSVDPARLVFFDD